ncbi:MAG: hypothetical protein WAK55_33070 [Xanthobacteraceae bacterium]
MIRKTGNRFFEKDHASSNILALQSILLETIELAIASVKNEPRRRGNRAFFFPYVSFKRVELSGA